MDNDPYTLDPDGDVILLFPKVNKDSSPSQSAETSDQVIPLASPTTSLTIDASAPAPDAHTVHTEGSNIPISVPVTSANQNQSICEVNDASEGGNTESHPVRMRVSSRHLALASPVFKRMFSGDWNEAHEIRSEGATEIIMDIWDLDAMLIVMNIVHGYAPKVPRKVDLDTLAKIAVIIDYYQCPGVVEVFAEMWVNQLKGDMPQTVGNAVIQWICIAWVFRKPAEFLAATRVTLVESCGIMQTYDLPVPIKVATESINECRQQGIREAMAAIDLVIDGLSSSQHNACSFECSSILLGALIKFLRLFNLIFPDPTPPFDNLSIASLARSLSLVRFPICEPQWPALMDSHFEQHRCKLELLLDPIRRDLESKMNGLSPNPRSSQAQTLIIKYQHPISPAYAHSMTSMTKDYYELDPDGDAIFAFTTTGPDTANKFSDPKAVPQESTTPAQVLMSQWESSRLRLLGGRMKVSSKHLSLASPVFKKMLHGPWQEAQGLRVGEVGIEMDRQNIDAMLMLMKVIHGHWPDIPRTVSLETLAEITTLVDYYNCQKAIHHALQLWIRPLLAGIAKASSDDIEQGANPHDRFAHPPADYRRMFSGPWKESQSLAAGDRAEIEAECWDANAMLILMNIIHGRGRNVPRQVTLRTLSEIAALVDYYECHEVVDVMSGIWIDKLLKSMPSTYCKGIISWIFISWVFQRPSSFTSATEIAATQSQQRIDPGDLPIPQRILDKIEEHRRGGVKSALDMSYELITDLRDGRKHCSDVCDALRLGLLIKQLHAGGQLPPLPAVSVPNVSLEQLTSILYKTSTVRYCDSSGVEKFQPDRYSSRTEERHSLSLHGCSLDTLIQPILQDVWNRLRGFELWEFKDESRASGGNDSTAPFVCCLTTSSLASTWPSTIDGKPLPDKWFQISLNETSLDTRDIAELAERTPITVCERTVIAVGACVGIASYVVNFARNIATTIKDLSNGGNCNTMYGTFEGLKWTYHSTGRNCDTTAQHDTIAGAIKKYLSNVEHNNVCGTQCLRMDHGRTWDGWLKLGPVSSFNENAYCGPSLSFDSCLSGGNNDI
ncbi:uncharacterized protein CDV56_105070 [Aspergillus thermomutatus]|uniref:Uncharacterized protein n=1 Tax=Aspergillus thermomutatus TaxID=41047 RepID=A0A397HD51_ASPTH|nr:uncharacterized protein CDV56_105070 [Aspergillus thermomutatus]RHZ59253.1 hypothetical protein CDV56_105070 [Aspergillus thermomutatus]